MVCRSCGRPLKSKTSTRRGYGPSCYKKIRKELNENKQVEIVKQLKGQIELDEVV